MKAIRSHLAPYIVAVLAVGSAWLLTLLLYPLLTPLISPLFFAAVTVSVWYGGLKPGMLASGLSTLAIGYFLIKPSQMLFVGSFETVVQLSVFLLVTILISSLFSKLRTAKKHLEMSLHSLQQSESRFRRLVESNIIGVIVGDLDGAIAEANDAFLKMVGYTRSDLMSGRVRWREISAPEYIEVSDRSIVELKSKGVHVPFEKEYIRKDNSRVPILVGSATLENNSQVISFVLDLTEYKHAENARKTSEERYRVFVEQSSEGIWRFEIEKPISLELSEDEQIQHFYQYAYLAECNHVMAQMYGFSCAEELVGTRLGDFVVACDPHNIEYLRSFIRSGYRLVDAESHEVDKYGNSKYFVNNLVGIVENGVLMRAWGTQRDITERKQAEIALLESEKRFRRLAESNIFGVAIGDFSGGISYANDYFLNMVGYTREELAIGEIRWDKMTPPEYHDLEVQASSEARTHGITTPFEKEYIRKDNSRVPILIGGALLEESNGIEQTIIFCVDLSERQAALRDRKRTQEALRQREDQLRLITNAVPVLISYVDAQQRYRFNNQKYEEWYGVPVSEIYGKQIQEFMDKSVYESVRPYIEAVLSGEQVTYQTKVLDKDGGSRYVEVSYIPQFNEERAVEGFVALISDISDRKKAEQEREQLLLREKAARTEAETANRLKDEFLATLSHELRTPLNAMSGWTQLLTTRKFDETTTARALETINRNTKTLKVLIEDVLDVSRIITGKLNLKITPVQLITVVEAALDTVRPAAEAKEIRLENISDSSVPLVLGDANRLQQIVWNLLSNAIKFTPHGGRVDVQLVQIDSHVQIRVRDTGEGIAAEFLPYVFERFRQADSSSTRSHGGLGLGLAIVRHLVELHGGTVRAESPGIGQGATFIVTLPLKPALKPTTPEQLSPTTTHEVAENCLPILEGLRVLVVDDEVDARELIKAMLQPLGVQVKAAASAIEALVTLQAFQPDVLVSDIGMPGENGYALIRQLRALEQEQLRRIPAVALTAYARAEDRTQALLAGFQLHVPKPVNQAELAAVVANLAGRT
ncbi:MAG: PAS domain S-box protein [Tolypothrix carrinoi HA7290-LM1]|jgi:PAS domain S-box-containing protein|nr:PAS domain S-box protein [Tolypothrix carrinoi HA7290-LM1]